MKRRKKIGWIFCLLSVLCLWGCGTKLFTKQEEIKTFSAFVSVPGKEIPDDNRMKNKIAEKIGAKAELKYLTGQTASEKIHSMIQKERIRIPWRRRCKRRSFGAKLISFGRVSGRLSGA